jgi:RNA polymerase sigma-70 factor (ECF subfamily)
MSYIRSQGYAAETTEDLTQTFFVHFIEDAYHASVDPLHGCFRAFLLVALKRFLIKAEARAHTLKRGGLASIRRLDDSQSGIKQIAAEGVSPEKAFEQSWASTVVQTALDKLRKEAADAGKLAMFEQLSEFLTEGPDRVDYERVARDLKLRRNTLSVAVHRLRRRLRELVRMELARTTAGRKDLESEMRDLQSALTGVLE